jgi:uncharacterized protein (TIGR03118 family)
MLTWIHRFDSRLTKRRPARLGAMPRLSLECLEERSLLSANVLQTNLVSDLPGVAQIQDPNLVNPWGISESSGSPFWISDNNAGVSTLYQTNPSSTPPGAISINPLVVGIPGPISQNGPGGTPLTATDPNGNAGAPTGTVFNGDSNAFLLTPPTGSTAKPAHAIFLFATEDGTIAGWNPGILGKEALIAVDNSQNPTAVNGAVYKGLAIATSSTPIFASDPSSTDVLYAANFRSGHVDVFDSKFNAVSLSNGAFTDPNLPKGYAPFNVQELTVNGVTKLYVTYAKQDRSKHDDVAGMGHGFVDVFNLDGTPGLMDAKGNPTVRLISRGVLDSPWGLEIAPASFGANAGALLVGNFGNGRINMFNATTGASMGTLLDPDGEPIQIDGLWALHVGNGKAGGLSNTVYFTAGIGGETHGLFGSLTPVAPGSPEGDAEAQMVQANLAFFQDAINNLNSDLAKGAKDATIRADIKAVNQAEATLVRSEIELANDTFTDAGLSRPSHGGLGHQERIFDRIFAELGNGFGHDR